MLAGNGSCNTATIFKDPCGFWFASQVVKVQYHAGFLQEQKITAQHCEKNIAGDGNRNRVSCLGSKRSTIELHQHDISANKGHCYVDNQYSNTSLSRQR